MGAIWEPFLLYYENPRSLMNPKQNRYTHLTKVKFIIKFLKTNDKEKILEGVRKKKDTSKRE